MIGARLGQLITAGLNQHKIQLCGLSLGAQLVGNIAKVQPVPLLVGLDPAGPGFYLALPRFTQGLADFTIEVHSDVGVYGTPYKNGDLIILPHDGHRFQPDCLTNTTAFSFTNEG